MSASETVIAEDAPIGVQLRPTLRPEHASNYTLSRVETVRTEHKTFVRWVYQNGRERAFDLGTEVVVQLQPAPTD